MKILILSIYSDSELYNKMLELQRKYINIDANIKYYFIQFRKQINDVEIENDFIYVNGLENRMKITEKTLKSIKYILNDLNEHYDFIIRTNISTIIHFRNLIDYLQSIPKTNIYCTGNLLNLQWYDHSSGIVNNSLFGTLYASGTSIIISYDVALFMINNISNFRHDIIDDVSIGVFMKKYLPSTLQSLQKYKASYLIFDTSKKIEDTNNYIFIRNRINNKEHLRDLDLIHMEKTIKNIYSINL
jgi:hypothetical protein